VGSFLYVHKVDVLTVRAYPSIDLPVRIFRPKSSDIISTHVETSANVFWGMQF
jgi:hypothetical protein